jgi:ABC-2 type transport system ATP-binding protein
MSVCLEVEGLSLSIKHNKILDHITFSMPYGKITALVGHNGAGKSTLMKAVMGWLQKDEGKVAIQEIDQDVDFLKFKTLFSFIPEEPLLTSELTVYQHFQLYGTSYGMDEKIMMEKVDYYMRAFEIEDKLHEFPEELSKGMRQKVQTICALIPDVPLLLIDEPFMGLDIYAAQFLIEELERKRNEGISILLTSHQIDKVKDLCDEYVLLHNGAVMDAGIMGEFKGLKRRVSDE